MADVKITDLVPQETIDKIKELNVEMQNVLATYTNVAKELAKGIQMKVDGIDDIAKMEELLAKKSKEAAELTEQLNRIMAERQQVIGQTTPVIAKNLMEVERLNKAHREEYTEGAKVQEILDRHNTKYKDQVRELQRLEEALEKNKAAQAANKKALKNGLIDVDAYNEKQVKLIASHRALTQEKRNLTLVMSAEEKAMLAVDTSYDQMSQQLALLKKAYRQLSAEDLKSDMGKEMELAIQNLSQHLNELDADMGEFHRNVGNYVGCSVRCS